MATPQKVQSYIEKHRINALFEDLMSRLVHNLPAEPVPYLIKILQKFDEKAKKQFKENPVAPKIKTPSPGLSRTGPKVRPKDPMSRSTPTLKTTHLSRSTPHLSKETTSPDKGGAVGGAAGGKGVYSWQTSSVPSREIQRGYQRPWASNMKRDKSVPGIYGEDRGYERPWIANMKKIKYEQSLQKARKLRKSSSAGGAEEESSKSTPSSEADVEQIFVQSQEKPPQRPKTLFSPGAQAWVSEMDTGPYRPPPPKPYQPPDQVEEAFLKEELSTDKLTKLYDKDSSSKQESEQQKVQERRAKPDQKAKKHKEALAALVEAQRKVETLGYLDSGGDAGDPDQGGYEEATDMLEDASDLMDEGITDVKTTGQKVRKRPPKQVTEVKVGVCSKCASVIPGGAGMGAGLTQGYGAYASIDSSSEVSFSSSSDFESASQVTGPRPMAWEKAQGEETRSTTSMTARSMTHDQASELFKSSSGRTVRIQSSTEVRTSQRWETGSYTSGTEFDRGVSRTEALQQSRSWPQPDSDGDSSV
ncbi:uncharacterized protein [Diadema antillarum]|uniref:uncharacterized protein n=1 Tax=Diadema antillarum TaxID=105358 RepID=UPI003A8477B2